MERLIAFVINCKVWKQIAQYEDHHLLIIDDTVFEYHQRCAIFERHTSQDGNNCPNVSCNDFKTATVNTYGILKVRYKYSKFSIVKGKFVDIRQPQENEMNSTKNLISSTTVDSLQIYVTHKWIAIMIYTNQVSCTVQPDLLLLTLIREYYVRRVLEQAYNFYSVSIGVLR